MSLNVTSGIVYSSGPVITVNATPVNIFGAAAASASGTAGITHYSGALNVNISGGQLAVSVSGNIVLVVSGGTIQTSGAVTAVSGSKFSIVSSGGNVITDYSGALNVNISGGVSVAGLQSGTMVVISGGGGAISGVATSVSGNVVYISGAVGVSSGGILPVQVVSGIGVGIISGGTIPVSVVSGFVAALSGLGVQAFSGGTIPVNPVSGAYIYGYQYSLVSGAGIVNVQSGASVLHAININAWVSGGQLAIQDSLSGNAGASVGVIDFIEVGSLATQAFPPQTLTYDVYMKSGIVIVTSGAALNATVSFRNPV